MPQPCGDEAELFRRYHDRLLRAVRARVRAHDAIVQDACSTAWLQLLRCQPERTTVFGWLVTVAIHEAWRLDGRERRAAHLEDVHPAALGEAYTIDAAIEAREALTILTDLPDRQRRYLTLLIAGYRYTDIARIADTSYAQVNKQLVRARAAIRQHRTNAS